MLKGKGAVGRRLGEDNLTATFQAKIIFSIILLFLNSLDIFAKKHLLSKFFKTGFDSIEIQNSFTVTTESQHKAPFLNYFGGNWIEFSSVTVMC